MKSVSRILIAEDEQQLRMGIKLSLKTNGYEVAEAADGVEALQTIMKCRIAGMPFDLLVCDYLMPRMTGEELLVKLKEHHAILPTLVMTGYGEKELLVRLLRAGCSAFIDKPFESSALCGQVAAMLAESSETLREMRRRDRLALIGERTRQTAHDLNNIIGGALGYADMALDKLEPDHPARFMVDKLVATSSRAAEICMNLLGYQRATGESSRLKTEINSLVARVGTLLQDIAPENITVTSSTLGQPVWFSADSERLQQALLNLGFNAFAAMKEGGQLTISLAQDRVARSTFQGAEQPCVILSIRDTGNGLSLDNMEHLFKEGFTNRENGFGIGLTIVKNIVEIEHNGWIEVASEIGKGTLFKLYFPVE
jgi:signal transduction histidine kinase